MAKPAKTAKSHPLDSEENQTLLEELMRFRRQARSAQADNRVEMATDEDYYDSIQLTDEQLMILADREQPVHIWNLVKSTCNWLIGTERKMRVDYNVLPRMKVHALAAKAKKKALKYVGDQSRDGYVRSEAFADSIRAGLGWLEEAVRSDGSKEPIFCRKEDWRNMWYDHLGREIDYSDWRYVIREKWVDLDVAQAMFPDRKDELEELAKGVNSMYPYNPEDTILSDPATEFDMENSFDALTGGAYDGYRMRVKLIEMWYRKPAKAKVLRLSPDAPYQTLDDVTYRKGDDVHDWMVENGYASLIDAQRMTVRVAMWAGSIFLQDEPTPYNHDRFPFIPVFCYRRKRDGMPYGMIRDIRSPQDAINCDRFTADALLRSNKIIMEEGACNNPAQFYEEYQRPDGIAMVNKGALTSGIKIVEGQALAQQHIMMIEQSMSFIERISGVEKQLKGEDNKGLSGKAIGLLQNQGMTTSSIPFDNYFESFQIAGEIRLSNVEQFMNEAKTLRVTGQGKDEFLEVNTPDPETGEVMHSMTAARADFIVGKQDYRESLRQAAMISFGETLTALMQSGGKAAECGFALLDIYVDMMDDLASKEDAVARIRKINGQEPPDDDITPQERQQRDEQRQQREIQSQEQQQLQKSMLQLEMRIKEAEASGKEAKADRDRTEALIKGLDGFIKAMEAAGTTAIAPELVQAADHLMEEAKNILGQQAPVQQPMQVQQIPQQGGM